MNDIAVLTTSSSTAESLYDKVVLIFGGTSGKWLMIKRRVMIAAALPLRRRPPRSAKARLRQPRRRSSRH